MNPRNSISDTTPSIQHWGGKRSTYRYQRGITLMMSLVFLLLLTILGVTSVNISTLQEKMSGNLRDQDVAFQAAESALRDGELAINQMWVTGKPTPISVASCSGTNCAWNTGAIDPLNDIWWANFRNDYGGGGKQLPETNTDPGYVIEYLQFDKYSIEEGSCYGPSCKAGLEYYRITARGTGTTAFSESILESTYKIER